jgi:glutamate-1-semialdehyde 2,1-aminomutase
LHEVTDDSYEALEHKAERLTTGLHDVMKKADIEVQTPRAFTLGGVFFAKNEVNDYDEAKKSDASQYARFFHNLLERNVFVAPSPFESMFPSLAHTDDDIDKTIEAASEAAALL